MNSRIIALITCLLALCLTRIANSSELSTTLSSDRSLDGGSNTVQTKLWAEGSRAGCCVGKVGDVNGDGNPEPTLGDIALMIDAKFISLSCDAIPCIAEADINQSGGANPTCDDISIGDISILIDYLYITGPENATLPACDGNTLTSAQREAVFNAIDSAYNSLSGLPSDSLARRLAVYLATRPELEAVGVADSVSIWARFIDGRMVMIPNNRFPSDGAAAAEPSGYVPSEPTFPPKALPETRPIQEVEPGESINNGLALAAPQYGLPHSVKAAVFGTLGPNCFQVAIGNLMVPLANNGYDILPLYYPQVADLVLNNYGFFYIESHGGVCESRNSVFITGIWTNTPYSNAADSVFKPNLDADELVYMYALGGSTNPCSNQWRYAFTGKFVAHFMHFTPNSFVYVSACSSDAPSLRAGFTTAGASVYVGWTMPVTDGASNKVGEFLVDRMIGANDSRLVPIESPKQRPFDCTQVLQDMKNRGWDVDPSDGSELRITELNPGFGILAPSLRFAEVINFSDTLFLTGYFGENPGSKGHVYVNGVEQTVYDWQPLYIWASIPQTGSGSAGPITVEVEPLVGSAPGGIKRKSNPINLTEWTGLFTYTRHDAGSLLGTIKFNAHLRADVHSFREQPHTAPAPNQYIVFGGALDSKSQGMVAGEFVYPVPNSDPPEVLTWSWNGTTPEIPPVPYFDGGEVNPWGVYLLQGSINAGAKSMALMVNGSAGGRNYLTETLVSSLYGLQYTKEMVLTPPYELYDVFPYSLSVNLETNWDIVGEEDSWSTCCSLNPDNDGSVNDLLHKITWQTIPAKFAPDPTAAQ